MLTLTLVCAITSKVLSQNFSTEFGKISKDEYELKTYSKDPNAEAIVLFNIGDSHFIQQEYDFDLVFEQQKRIKILTDAGMKYAEIEIPFYREGNVFEKINKLEAYTYNYKDGVVTRTAVDPKNIHDEKINDNWSVRKFAMPDVKEGSIIEYRYKLSTQYLFNLRDWYFQDKIPTVYSKYIVQMIPFYEYTYVLQGTTKLDSYKTYSEDGLDHQFGSVNYKDFIHEFIMNDVPAFNDESYITSVEDYIMKIDFQLSKIKPTYGGGRDIITTWPDLIKDFENNSDFGKFITKCEKLAPKIIDIKKLETKPLRERFEEVMSFVKFNFKWNGHNSKYASKSPASFEKDKFGNAADINLFTVGLLNAVGIDAYPVLISTRKNGKVNTDYPYFHYFNYALIYARFDNINVLTDATDIYCSSYRIPERCINERGLLVKQNANKDVYWLELKNTLPTQTTTKINMHIENDELKSSVGISANEYNAVSFKEEIGNDTEKLLEYLKKKNYHVDKEHVSISDMTENSKLYIFEFQPDNTTEIINGKIYISPFLNEPMKANPLKQETRTYPVDMIYPWRDAYFTTIEIPEGYKVEFVPENFKVENDLVEMNYIINQTNNKLEITFTNFFKKAVYPAEVYSKIKYYMNQMVKKGNEKIVLIKS